MMDRMHREDRSLRQAVADVVGIEALSREAIADALVERGVLSSGDGRDRLDRFLQLDTTFGEVTSGVICVPKLLEGTAWTVWVDPDDAAHDFVRTHPHLTPLGWWLIGDEVSLLDTAGHTLGTLDTDGRWLDGADTDVVTGPEGWLDDLAGSWASVEVLGGGLRWSACASPPEPTAAQAAAMKTGFERAARHEAVDGFEEMPVDLEFCSGDNPILEAVLADRSAFAGAPIAPLPALYEAAGLEQRGPTIAADGFDWEALRSWQHRNRLAATYGLEERGVEALVLVVGACQLFLSGDPDALGPSENERDAAATLLAGLLEDGDVAVAFWGEAPTRGISPEDIGEFVDGLTSRLDGFVPAGLGWLRARCFDDAGDVEAALALLEDVVTPDCDHLPALVELAGFAADRGDAPRALRLLRQAGVPERASLDDEDHEPDDAEFLLFEIEGFATNRPRPLAGRNDPCPCGSGRKYKACHLGKEQHPLADRAGWLYQKAERFLHRTADHEVADLADAMAGDDYRVYRQLRDSPVVADLALHEGGVFAEFLADRSALLPDDEALLAAQWALVDRAVYEVQRVDGQSLDLHDIGRSEDITITNVHPDSRMRPGVVLVGRPLPVGDTHRAFSGFLEIQRALVRPVLDAIDSGDPFEVAAALAAQFRPPRLQNTDGDEMVFHTLRWRLGNAKAVDAALVGSGLRTGGDGTWSLVRDSANQSDTVIASLRLEGDELIGDVNSDERAAALRSLVEGALPDAVLLDDEARSIDEAMADYDPADAPPPLDHDDSMVRDVLAQFVAEYEQRWLDESIPALGGRTPREAAEDPIGREELRQLLGSFPSAAGNPGAMDPDRLLAALGLDGDSFPS